MGNRTILLVDDSADDIALARRALRKGGVDCDLQTADDGQKALDLLLPSTGPAAVAPRVVFLDLKMPGFSGFDVLERLRQGRATRHLPVVVFSSSREPQDILRARDLGASSFVRKPIDHGDFAATVCAMGRYWLDIDQTVELKVLAT